MNNRLNFEPTAIRKSPSVIFRLKWAWPNSKPGFNITLFHYRNTGGDTAHVLAGIVCADERVKELEDYLKRLGYPFVDQSANLAFQGYMRE